MDRRTRTTTLATAGGVAIIVGVSLMGQGGELSLVGLITLIAGVMIFQLIVVHMAVVWALEVYFANREGDGPRG